MGAAGCGLCCWGMSLGDVEMLAYARSERGWGTGGCGMSGDFGDGGRAPMYRTRHPVGRPTQIRAGLGSWSLAHDPGYLP